jgi:hypothetical protein
VEGVESECAPTPWCEGLAKLAIVADPDIGEQLLLPNIEEAVTPLWPVAVGRCGYGKYGE